MNLINLALIKKSKMRIIIFFILFTLFLSCNRTNNNNNELANKIEQLEQDNQELNEKIEELENDKNSDDAVSNNNVKNSTSETFENSTKMTTRFAYVVFKVSKPRLHHTDDKYIRSINIPGQLPTQSQTIKGINYVEYDSYIITTDVVEIKDYNEDAKYKLIDEQERIVKQQVSNQDVGFHIDVMSYVEDPEERTRMMNTQSKVIDRKCMVFNSYKEASKFRLDNKGTF